MIWIGACCLIPILNSSVSRIAIMGERVSGEVRIVASHEYSAGRTTLENELTPNPKKSEIPVVKTPLESIILVITIR